MSEEQSCNAETIIASTPDNLTADDLAEDSVHEVGHGSPPSGSRWPKGVSGNPYGRPKRRPTSDDMFLAEMDRPIKVVENGRTSMKNPEQVMFSNLVRKAAARDIKAIKDLLALMGNHEKKYGWDKCGWNKSNYWETFNWKKEMEFMMSDQPDEETVE
jgi:Family of unknown function (DUF5681)